MQKCFPPCALVRNYLHISNTGSLRYGHAMYFYAGVPLFFMSDRLKMTEPTSAKNVFREVQPGGYHRTLAHTA